MIHEVSSKKIALNIEKNNNNIKTNVTKSVKADAPSSAVVRSAASLAASAGLPADRLSSSIVSFARFFSLPLKPETLAAIRRQALMPQTPSLPNAANSASSNSASPPPAAQNANASDTSSVLKTREALSLTAAAAESKGVELTQKGLENYAEAVDPDWQRNDADQYEQHDKRERKNNEEKKEDNKHKENVINADTIKKLVNEFTDNNKLLEILNKLPSKNGKRFVVLPFEFADNGNQYKVSMRMLLEDENRVYNMAMQITMNSEQLTENSEQLAENREQIAENREQFTNKKWLFSFEFERSQTIKIVVYSQNDMHAKDQSSLKKELSMSMEIPAEKIFIKCSSENFPHEADCDDQFLSINEAV